MPKEAPRKRGCFHTITIGRRGFMQAAALTTTLRRKDGSYAYGLEPPPGTDKTLTSQQRVESPQDAAALAKGQMQQKNQAESTCTLDFPGDPRLVAGITLTLEGFGFFSGKFLVKKATHKVGGSGYGVSVELVRCGRAADVALVTATDEALAKPARTVAASAAADDVLPPMSGFVNAVDVWAASVSYHKNALVMRGATDTEKTIFCVPRIAQHVASSVGSARDAEGWLYLSGMMYKWLHEAPARDKKGNLLKDKKNRFVLSDEPFWVDLDWSLQFKRARQAYEDFIKLEEAPNRIWNAAAQKRLGEVLMEQFTVERLKSETVRFDFINAHWKLWDDVCHNFISVPGAEEDNSIDGCTAALASFTYRGLASGYSMPMANGKGFAVVPEVLAVYLCDVFNFDLPNKPSAFPGEYLGAWNCDALKFSLDLTKSGYVSLWGHSFRALRDSPANVGRDFFVLSEPRVVTSEIEVAIMQKAIYEYPC